jgi:hypothetical protein
MLAYPRNAAWQAHQENIDRYYRLLKTQLTDIERDFIERRICEEKDTLRQLIEKAAPASSDPRAQSS